MNIEEAFLPPCHYCEARVGRRDMAVDATEVILDRPLCLTCAESTKLLVRFTFPQFFRPCTCNPEQLWKFRPRGRQVR